MNIDALTGLGVSEAIKEMIKGCFDYTRNSRRCSQYSDLDFVLNGLDLVFENKNSGREYLQYKNEVQGTEIKRSTFFTSLHSDRRKNLIDDISAAFQKKIEGLIKPLNLDYYSEFPELIDYDLFAGDGHYISKSCHTKSNSSKKAIAAGNLYIQDLRNGFLQLLSPITDGKRRNHEIPVFRDNFYQAPKIQRKKRIWILDRAYVDKIWWARKYSKNELFITLVKKNFKYNHCGNLDYDPDSPINTGIEADFWAGLGNSSRAMRFVQYTDPETKETYRFITTVEDLPPGLIAWLYFKRWTIEKSFDNLKNDLYERKAWASGENALQIQAQCTVMAYNFIRLINSIVVDLFDEEEKQKFNSKYNKQIIKREEKAKKKGRNIHFFHKVIQRMPKIAAQFIRTIKNHFRSNIPIKAIIWRMKQALILHW